MDQTIGVLVLSCIIFACAVATLGISAKIVSMISKPVNPNQALQLNSSCDIGWRKEFVFAMLVFIAVASLATAGLSAYRVAERDPQPKP